MIRPILILALLFMHGSISAQRAQYQRLDQLGWEFIDFQVPDHLTELDTGKVNYLVTVNGKGKVRDVKLLQNTLPRHAEKMFRALVGKSLFRNTGGSVAANKKVKGTLLITRSRCNQPVATGGQIKIFEKP